MQQGTVAVIFCLQLDFQFPRIERTLGICPLGMHANSWCLLHDKKSKPIQALAKQCWL